MKKTEARALASFFLLIGSVLFGSLLALMSMHANRSLVVIVFIVGLAVGSIGSSQIVIHYADKAASRRDRR